MQTIRSVKTRIGGASVIEIPKISNPKEVQFFDMTQCSALLLKTIRQSLYQQFNQEIDEVVITVPAAFNTDERQATINAAFLAGFKRIYILDEPTATLLYYINGGEGDLADSKLLGEKNMYTLVYDLGGGTLDVSITKIQEDEDGDVDIDIVERSPRMDVGGDNFDQYLAAYFLSEFEKVRPSIEKRTKEEQSQIIARIISQAEDYKISMNDAIKQCLGNMQRLEKLKKYVNFEIVNQMYIQDIVLNKQSFDDIFSDLVNNQIIAPIKHTLIRANIDKEQIAEVLITGGMTKFYAVEEALRRFFPPTTRLILIDSEASVSKGAAIHHYNQHRELLRKIKVEDRMGDDIFIKVGDEFKMFFDRTTKPNQNGIFDYTIQEEGLTELPIFLYCGTSDDPNHFVALSGKFIPLKRRYFKGENIDIRWNLDKNKTIAIQIVELDEKVAIQQEQYYTQEEIRKNPIQPLKINP